MTAEQVLQKYWGYSTFRLSQKEVITSILFGNDTLALLPTGGGKSVCYQVPGLLFQGLTLVISPLISLMKDQVDGLLKRGISATYLASTLAKEEQKQRMRFLQEHTYKFLYVSPEKLKSAEIIELLNQVEVSLIVIDESHCVSIWGNDFRPSYLEIPNFISQLTKRPILAALTATATPDTKNQIISGLQLNNPQIFQSSFKRNIAITILHTSSLTEHELHLLSVLKNNHKSGIIYTSSRKETERLTARLNQFSNMLGIKKVGCYHAGLTALQRQETQQLFIENKLQLLVATTAFGMGIDKPDIEFVIHYHPPASLEGYYQEIGRAGRSGQHSSALLLFNPLHLNIHHSLLSKNNNKKSLQMFEDVKILATSKYCRMKGILEYFGEKSEKCEICDFCLPNTSILQKLVEKNYALTKNLIKWREVIAQKYKVIPEIVLSPKQIVYILILQPKSSTELLTIPGIGQGWIDFWSKHFLAHEWYNTEASIN